MKLRMFAACGALLLALTQTAQADLIVSTSSSDPFANDKLAPGQPNELYLWLSSHAGETITGIEFDIVSSDGALLAATSHDIELGLDPEDPAGDILRWAAREPGTLGTSELVTGSFALAIPGNGSRGVSTEGLDDFVLFSTLAVDVAGMGSTELGFQNADVVYDNFGDTAGFQFTGGNFSAVPEPGTVGVLSAVGLGFGFYTYRRRRQKAARA